MKDGRASAGTCSGTLGKQLFQEGPDPWANEKDAIREYGVTLTDIKDVKDADCIIVAVAHNEFKALSVADIKKLYSNDKTGKVLVDVKGIYKKADLIASGLLWWRL